jgi:hypothetical protein
MEEYPLSDEQKALIEEKDSLLNQTYEDFFDGWGLLELALFAIIWKYVSSFKTENGKFVFDDENVQKVAGINTVAASAIQQGEYPKKVRDYISAFGRVTDLNSKIQSSVNGMGVKELEDLLSPVQRQNVQITLNGLTGAGINTEFIEPMKIGIYRNIVAGGTVTDMEVYIRDFIVSNQDRLGRFQKYAGQIARDSIYQYDGLINSLIGEKIGANAYLYVGGLVKDSRPQCIRWDGKGIIRKSQLITEIAWANLYGSGMIPGTNPENFTVYRGGYNCRHTAVPIKI